MSSNLTTIPDFPKHYPCGTPAYIRRFTADGLRWRVLETWPSGAALAGNEVPSERPKRTKFIEIGTLVDPILEPYPLEVKWRNDFDPVQCALRKLSPAERKLLGLPEPETVKIIDNSR